MKPVRTMGKTFSAGNGSSPFTLPFSKDAERGLLCSILLAPDRVLSQESWLTPDHFHVPANAEVFAQFRSMHDAGKPIDLITATQWLEDRKVLNEVGGAAAMSEIFTFAPTAANSREYASILAEKFFARQAILTGQAVIAAATQAKTCDDCRSLPERVCEAFSKITEASGPSLLREILAARRFDANNPPEPAKAIYEINRQPICTPGNLTAISSHIKSGKSAWIGALAVATLGRDGDTLGVDSDNPGEHAVIHFDSEQSPADHHTILKIALSRVGLKDAPPWIRSYHLLGLPLTDRWALLEYELKEAQKEHGAIHSALLDGYADYVKDPNDPDESFAAVERFHQLAARYSTTFTGIIHFNPGPAMKTRGHLGSQLARKAESNIELCKEDEITTVYTSSSRHAFISKEDGPRFRWDRSAGMHVSCATGKVEKASKDDFRLRCIAEDIFSENTAFRYGECTALIMRIAHVKERQAKEIHHDMAKALIIRKNLLNQWELSA